MTFASTNRSNIRYILETQWGSTPTTGVTREARQVSNSMSVKKNVTKSNEIRDDRMVSDIIETEMMSDGGIHQEFSAGAMDDFFQAFVLGTWTRPMTFDFWAGTTVSWISTSKIAVVGPDITGYLTVGRRMKSSGFVNPNNNDFWQISALTFNSGAGQTEITFAASTATIEAANVKGRIEDANDVVVLKSTAIRAGTAGAASFDSNGGNAFASAIAAGQLLAGQKIHVEGLGYESGTAAFTAVAVVGSSVTVSDGENSYTFVAGTDFAVGTTNATSATNLAAAINNSRVNGVTVLGGLVDMDLKATAATGTVTVVNLNGTGGTISKTESGTNITVVNFAGGDLSQHGVYTIVSATADALFVSPAPTTNANAGSIAVTFRGSMLRNPSSGSAIVPQSFSFEEFDQDVSLGFKQDGMMANTFQMDLSASAILTGSFEFMGRGTVALTTTKLGTAPYTPLGPVASEITNATTDVGQISKNGVTLSTALKSIKIDGKAQLRNQMAVGSKFPVGIGTGRFELTGSCEAYFQNLDFFNNMLNHDTVSLSWNVEDSTLHTYFFTLPAVKISADAIDIKGIDQDIFESVSFEAFRDPTSQSMFQIDRFSSLLPV